MAEFDRFVAAGGAALRQFALFEAIAAEHPRVPWHEWPQALREPDARGTSTTSRAGTRAGSGSRSTCNGSPTANSTPRPRDARARAASRSGSFAISPSAPRRTAPRSGRIPSAFARGVSIGAPPDPFARDGQNWNLPPPNPDALLASGGAGFRESLAANMRHAGALRIDHVMGLARLFWIPDGARAAEGAYVHYPLDALLGVLAEESVRARCLVVGEDLGTVPEGLRERLAAADVLSYRVLWFEREGTRFVAPARYPADRSRTVSTHDLPTIAGWWTRRRHRREGLARPASMPTSPRPRRRTRRAAKRALVEAIDEAGVAAGAPLAADAPHDDAITAAIHRYRGRGGLRAGAPPGRRPRRRNRPRSIFPAPTGSAPTGGGRCASASTALWETPAGASGDRRFRGRAMREAVQRR